MKNRFIAALLAIFLGGFGVHKFYLGKWNGIFYLLLCWTYVPVIIAFIEGVLYLVNGLASLIFYKGTKVCGEGKFNNLCRKARNI